MILVRECRGWEYCHKVTNPNCNQHECDDVHCGCNNIDSLSEDRSLTIKIEGVEL